MYTSFYNLSDRPFRLTPDLHYFYSSSSHKRAIAHLRFGLEQSNGVMVLTGDKGSGKTTLVQYMLSEMDDNSTIVAYIQKPALKDTDFLPAILASLQIPITDYNPKNLFESLHRFLSDKISSNNKVLLIIDEGQHLTNNTIEFLRLLSMLKIDDQGLLQILISGTNELDELIAEKQNQSFRKQIVMSYNMHPMQISDTRAYIKYRLQQSGWQGDPQIEDETYLSIHQLSGGLPYEINHYFDRLLVLGMLQESHKLSNADVARLTTSTMEKIDEYELKHASKTPDLLVSPSQIEEAEEPKVFVEEDNPQSSFHVPDLNETTANKNGDSNKKESSAFFDKGTIATIVICYVLSFISVIAINQYMESEQPTMMATAPEAVIPAEESHTDIEKDLQTNPIINSEPEKNTLETLDEFKTENIAEPVAPIVTDVDANIEVINRIVQTEDDPVPETTANTEISEDVNIEEAHITESEPLLTELPDVLEETVVEEEFLDLLPPTQDPVLTTNDEPEIVRLVKAEPTESVVNSSFSREPISDINLNQLVAQFEIAYQFGDMPQVDKLFSEEIKSNNINNKKVLVDEYEKLFNITEFRRMRIYDMSWDSGLNQAIGEGSFEASIREKGAAKKQKYLGTIILHVKKQEKGLEITELYYNYENL